MRTLFIIDHPYQGSFSRALLAAAMAGAEQAGHDVDLIDLAADEFNPAMTAPELNARRSGESLDPLVLDYQAKLGRADHVAFVFPIWWMNMPARTKGFLDKVLLPGISYDEPRPGGRLVGRYGSLTSVTLLTTSTTPTLWYQLLFGRPAVRALFTGTFGLIGVRRLRWLSHGNISRSDAVTRTAWLRRASRRFARLA